MSVSVGNKIEIRRRALLEAMRFCGGVKAYSERLKVSRTRASNWVNQPDIDMPYEFAVLTEEFTHVSVERLSPYTEMTNQVMRRLRSKETLLPVNMELDEIQIGTQSYSICQKPDRPILVGTDGILITGLGQIEMFKSMGFNKIQVTILDLEALLLGDRSLQNTNIEFSISERVAIGLRLEQMLGHRQGKRNDLKKSNRINQESSKDIQQLRPRWDEVGRVDIYISKLIGFGKGTYHRARYVCLKGTQSLIDLMDRKEITIATAEKKVAGLKKPQSNHEQLKLVGVQP